MFPHNQGERNANYKYISFFFYSFIPLFIKLTYIPWEILFGTVENIEKYNKNSQHSGIFHSYRSVYEQFLAA